MNVRSGLGGAGKRSLLLAAAASASIATGVLAAWLQAADARTSPVPELIAGPGTQQSQLVRRARPHAAPPVRLRASRIFGSEDAPFGRPHDLVVSGAYLVVLDRGALDGSQLLLLDRETGEVVHSTGRSGQGPREFNGAQSVQVDVTSYDRIWINDYRNGRLVLYDLRRWAENPLETIAMPGSPFQAYWVNDGLVTNGLYATEVLRKFERSGAGDSLEMVEAIGPLALEDSPPAEAADWNRSSMAVTPSGDRIAVGFVFLDRIRLYDSAGVWTHEIIGPREIHPDYEARTWGYTYLAATDQYVYGLFVGRPVEENTIASTTLHVFDWDGQFVGEIELDTPIMRPAVSSDDRILWGVQRDPYPAIVEFGSLLDALARGEP